jgi:hypothetical protein
LLHGDILGLTRFVAAVVAHWPFVAAFPFFQRLVLLFMLKQTEQPVSGTIAGTSDAAYELKELSL